MESRKTRVKPDIDSRSVRGRPSAARDHTTPQAVGQVTESVQPFSLVEEVLRLQRLVGNQAVQRALTRDGPHSMYYTMRAVPGRGGQRRALTSIQRNAKFDAIAGPSVEKTGAPEELAIPQQMKDGMDAAWAASFPGGTSQEQGGILVRKANGEYEWRAGPPGAGGSFMPNYGDVKTGETLIATGHTHPYDASEGGDTGVSLSGGDISSMVYDPAPTGVVHAGTGLFIVAKTKEFEQLVAATDTKQKKRALANEIDDAWDSEFAKAMKSGQTFVPAVETAAKIVCAKYHLLYYAGSAQKMEQPAKLPKVHVEMDASKVGGPAK